MVGIIRPVGNNEMVHQVQSHHVASAFDALRQFVILSTGPDAAAGVVVADGKNGGIGKHSLAHDDADVDRHFRDAAVGNAQFLDESEVLVHQQHPELFHVEVLHHWVHVVVDACCRAEVRTLFALFHLPALAQFAGRYDGDGFGRTDAVVFAKVVYVEFSQSIKVVVAVSQDAFHEVDGRFLCRTRTNEYSQQFCI